MIRHSKSIISGSDFRKWSFFTEPGLVGSRKNKKIWFFLVCLKYFLMTCFESKKFLWKLCPELSNQVFSFSACQIRQPNSKLLTNLPSWKTEYLIAQLRTGFQQKLFRLKKCPHGVLHYYKPTWKNQDFLSLPLQSSLSLFLWKMTIWIGKCSRIKLGLSIDIIISARILKKGRKLPTVQRSRAQLRWSTSLRSHQNLLREFGGIAFLLLWERNVTDYHN